MTLEILSLGDLIKSNYKEEEIKTLLFSFKSKRIHMETSADDVEEFLHMKSIQFETMGLSRTYLVMSTYEKKSLIVGYFSISNRPLVIMKKNFQLLPLRLRKRLMGMGHKTDQDNYEIQAYLIGQLGKNCSREAQKAKAASGSDILSIAHAKILEAHKLVGGRVIYLECEHHEKLKKFYTKNGYEELEKFETSNCLCLMVKKIE